MKEFIELKKYGKLYIDKVLFESYFPIIFTCVNDKKDVFICVCCQNNEKGCKWLVGKTDGKSIVKMLRDKITVRQLLLEYSSGKISIDYAENKYVIFYNNSDWDKNSPYLPKKDSYMYAEDGEFEDEINYFSLINDDLPYKTEHYESITKETQKGIEPIADELEALFPALEGISIPSKIMYDTLKVCGELTAKAVTTIDVYMDSLKYEPVYNKAFNISSDHLSLEVGSNNDHYADAA